MTNDVELLTAINADKLESITEIAIAAGWFSLPGRPARSKAYRAVRRLMVAKLVTVKRRYGQGNGGYGGAYSLTKQGKIYIQNLAQNAAFHW